MHTDAAWLALIIGLVCLFLGVGGTVAIKSGKLAITGAFGAVLILIAFLIL